MIGTQHLFSDCERLLVSGASLFVPFRFALDIPQVAQGVRDCGMVGVEHLSLDFQCLLIKAFGSFVITQPPVNHPHIVQDVGPVEGAGQYSLC